MGWYITILQEMRDDLGLKGNELLVFAFINGFSQEGQGCYFGSLATLQRVCGIASRQTAISTLKSLMAKGYIVKSENVRNGVKEVTYSVCPKIGQGVQKMDTDVQELDMGCPEIGHNNKEDNKYINKDSLFTENPKFKKPTVEEIRSYCQERGNKIDPEQFYNFYESKGWKIGKSLMKDWKASIRTWEIRIDREKKETMQRKREPGRSYQKESTLSKNLKALDQMFGTNSHQQVYGKKEEMVDEQ